MPSLRSHLSLYQYPAGRSTHVCQPEINHGSATQITDIWYRFRHGMDLSKHNHQSAICDAMPTRIFKTTSAVATIPTPAATVPRPWKENSSAATTVWRQYVSTPPGLVVTDRGRPCRTIQCKKIMWHTTDPHPK